MTISREPPNPGSDPAYLRKGGPDPMKEPNTPATIRKADLAPMLKDLADGAEYQRKLMPAGPPEIPGYEFGVLYRGARMVSGDFYDFLSLDGGKLGIAVADASGKGIPASLLTMTTRALLRAQPEPDAPPARVLSNVNRLLAGNIPPMMFVSAVYAVLDTSWHTLTVANAGHLPTVVWRSREKVANTFPARGAVLGPTPQAFFEERLIEDVIPLEPGDRFLLITDGVNEAMAPGEKEFGMEHLRKRLASESDGRSADFLRRLIDQIDIHRGGGEQSDDITVVTGRRLP